MLGCSDPGASKGGEPAVDVLPGDGFVGDSEERSDAAVDASETSAESDVSTDAGSNEETAVESGFPYIIVEPEALDFGALPVGGEKTLELELENARLARVPLLAQCGRLAHRCAKRFVAETAGSALGGQNALAV